MVGICSWIIWISFQIHQATLIAMATNFGQKSPNDLHLSHCNFETDWNIAILTSVFIASMICLRRVKIWWTSVQWSHRFTRWQICTWDDKQKFAESIFTKFTVVVESLETWVGKIISHSFCCRSSDVAVVTNYFFGVEGRKTNTDWYYRQIFALAFHDELAYRHTKCVIRRDDAFTVHSVQIRWTLIHQPRKWRDSFMNLRACIGRKSACPPSFFALIRKRVGGLQCWWAR